MRNFQVDQIKGNIDFLMFRETQLDESLPQSQFKISGFSRPLDLIVTVTEVALFYFEALSKSIGQISSKYEDFFLMGNFIVGLDDAVMKDFCNLYILNSLINKPTCNKTRLTHPALKPITTPNKLFCFRNLLQRHDHPITIRWQLLW